MHSQFSVYILHTFNITPDIEPGSVPICGTVHAKRLRDKNNVIFTYFYETLSRKVIKLAKRLIYKKNLNLFDASVHLLTTHVSSYMLHGCFKK